MLQTCIFRSTLPPGPCGKVILGYHSPLENGNPSLSRMLKKSIFSPTPARRDAPIPMRRSRIIQTLHVPHLGNELAWQLEMGG